MTRDTTMDKDHLAAFVDGELSPEDSAKVVMHLANHPQDQAYVDDLMAANTALGQAFATPMEEPVPDALRDLILGKSPETAQVLPFRRKIASTSLWGGMAAGAALAASLTVLVFLPQVGGNDLSPGQLADSGDLHQALTSLPAGEPMAMSDGSEVIILSSMPTPTGYCREIEVTHPSQSKLQAALACTKGDGWTVEVVISEDLADAIESDGFGTASGDEAQSFAPFLDRIQAGTLLDPEAEAEALARGWVK